MAGDILNLVVSAIVLVQAGIAASADDRTRGQELFQSHCATCHGPNGEGGRGPTLAVPKLVRAQTEGDLVDVIWDGIPGSIMPKSILALDDIKQIAAWVRRLGELRFEVVAGNPDRGAQLYRSEKGACIRCHAIRGRGGAIGPDLTDIGSRRGAAHLRTSLTEPGADVPKGPTAYRSFVSIPDNFVLVRATKDGKRTFGVRVNEDTFSIQIRDLSGQLHSFLKSELAELRKEWGQSPMPSYGSVFTSAEIDDIVAFLASQRGAQ